MREGQDDERQESVISLMTLLCLVDFNSTFNTVSVSSFIVIFVLHLINSNVGGRGSLKIFLQALSFPFSLWSSLTVCLAHLFFRKCPTTGSLWNRLTNS